MLKKIIIIFIVLLGAFVGIFVYQESLQRPIISNTLSARSQEYLDGKKSATSSALKNADFTGPSGEDTRNKRISLENCYSFVIPYRVTVTRNDPDANGNTCFVRYSFDTPKGALVIYKTAQKVTSWDDIGGVKFRRDHKDEYREEMKSYNGRSFLVFYLKDQLYEANAFYYGSDYTLTFNLLTKTNENLDKDLFSMLDSLQLE